MVAFLFTIVSVYGATTISTNITTGGTLTVSGNSTFGDAITDVNLFTGILQASTTALFTDGAIMYDSLILSTSGDATTEGGIYYDSSAKVIKLYDGSSWFTVGTSTDGMTLSTHRVSISDMNHYMTFGTTTQSALSVMTLEATSTAAIPLTIRGYEGQTANLFQVHNVSGTELFALDHNGNASTTMLTSTADIWAGGGYTAGTGSGVKISTAGVIQLNSDLEINGRATTTGSTGAFATRGTVTIEGAADLVVDTDTLFVDNSADKVGVGSSTPWATLGVNADVGVDAFVVGSTTELMKIDSEQEITFPGAIGDFIVDTDTLFVDNSTDKIGFSTTTPPATLSIGTKSATSTIMTGYLCIVTERTDGTTLYMWPCVEGADCKGAAWATSTTRSCE